MSKNPIDPRNRALFWNRASSVQAGYVTPSHPLHFVLLALASIAPTLRIGLPPFVLAHGKGRHCSASQRIHIPNRAPTCHADVSSIAQRCDDNGLVRQDSVPQ